MKLSMNVNETIKVKLKEPGIIILRNQHEKIYDEHPNPPKFVEPKIDGEGYCNFQLWDFMATFGPHLSMGFDVPFETEIILL